MKKKTKSKELPKQPTQVPIKVKWTKVTDTTPEEVQREVGMSIEIIKKLEKKELKVIADIFQNLPAHSRLNLFGNLLEFLYNACALPDYLKIALLHNSQTLHQNMSIGKLSAPVEPPNTPDGKLDYVG